MEKEIRKESLNADVIDKINDFFSSKGLESYPFKIGWYNEVVDENFKFPYKEDTLAVVIISTPSMFEAGLLPYILREECPGGGDMLDNYLKGEFAKIQEIFPQHDIEAIHDFELHPSHRPKVLVQTAGHVAGAAYYYQRKDVQPDPWGEETKIFGVSVHPKFGGWFALRGVLIFKDLQCPDLPKKAPDDIVPTHELRKELLERFNFRWQDWTYRDIIPVEGKYSEHQKLYFETPPKDRPQLIQKLKRELK